jgi:hypothetical protein
MTPTSAAPKPESPGAGVFPSIRDLIDPVAPFLIPLVLLVVARIVTAIQVGNGTEDAYITYRYAQHLALGGGLTYNPGERVMGFSSPLWAMWNALGFFIAHQPLLWSRATSLVADAVTLLVMGALLERHASRRSAWCFTFFFALWPYFPAVAMSGLETSVMLALIALSAALAAARSWTAGLALAALALTRPEGLVAALVLGLGATARARLVGIGLVAAGLGALAAYFGTIVPQSVIAKALTYGTPGPLAGRAWWEWLLPFPLGRWPELSDLVMMVPLSAILAPAVVVGARALWRERSTPLARAAAAMLVVWLGYALLGVTYFWWYLAVPLAGFAAVAAVGFPRIAKGAGLYVSVALLVIGVWSVARYLYIGRARQESSILLTAAELLRAQAQPGDKAMLEPIGMIGYVAPVIVIDEVGLVSPRVARRRRAGAGWYADIVTSERPEWLVVRYGTYRSGAAFAGVGAPFRGVAERDALFARYRPVAGGEAGSSDQALVILRRSD